MKGDGLFAWVLKNEDGREVIVHGSYALPTKKGQGTPYESKAQAIYAAGLILNANPKCRLIAVLRPTQPLPEKI